MHANPFERFAHMVAHLSGKPVTFGVACLVILVWAVTGPIFGFSETWQLIINTGTTIVTFLMVFILQNSQNRDGLAVQAKLDELILVSSKAENSFIAAEQLSEQEITHLRAIISERAAQSDERQRLHPHAHANPAGEPDPPPLRRA